MKFTEMLAAAERHNASMLCVGLDPEPAKFPTGWRDDPRRIFDFCAAIVDATRDLVIAFKPPSSYLLTSVAPVRCSSGGSGMLSSFGIVVRVMLKTALRPAVPPSASAA